MRIKATFPAALLGISLALLFAPSVAGQTNEKQKKLERRQLLERKTYVLVDEIATGALGLKLPENRSFVFAAAADLLWDHDQPRARNLFWDALNTITLMYPVSNEASEKEMKQASNRDKEQRQSLTFAVFALRQELIRRVARRDPQLALDMLRSTHQQPLEPLHKNFPLPDDRRLEQQIAAEAASRDPQRALQLARESLSKGLSFELLNLLYQLNERDGELGSKFAADIIDKIRGRNIATDLHGARIAISLLSFSRVPTALPAAQLVSSPQWRPLKLDRDQRREIVDLLASAALTGSANANLLYDINAVMQEIEEFAPERVAPLQRKLAAFNQTLNKEQRLSQEYSLVARNGTPEELLKLANKAGDDERGWMQQQAIAKAVTAGRVDSLREFVNTEIEDQSRRKGLLDALDTAQIELAANRGAAEELRKLLPQIRRKEERARAMTQIAMVLEKKGDHDEALKLLDEAQVLIRTDLNSETQTNALISLVAAYALVEPAKAFGIIERVIDSANDEIAKALLLDKIVNSGAVKKGEIRLQQSGIIPIDFAVFKYGFGVAALANADFERTKAVADRFERNELRLMARLMLAQSLRRDAAQPPSVR